MIDEELSRLRIFRGEGFDVGEVPGDPWVTCCSPTARAAVAVGLTIEGAAGANGTRVENLEDELCFDAREPGLRVTVLGPLARLGP